MSDVFFWEKCGQIISPQKNHPYLWNWISASCSIPTDLDGIVRLYITGMDMNKRSVILTCLLNLETLEVSELSKSPVVALGRKGTLDENGTGYPTVIKIENDYYLFHLGWIQGVHVPWYNGLFLSKSSNGIDFKRVSEAPIFDRNHSDPLGIGSMCLLKEGHSFSFWYSRFESWGKDGDDKKHYYNIKRAHNNGVTDSWEVNDQICINFESDDEYAIAKPSVIKIDNTYIMWYSYRGESYKIGFAYSKDGQNWTRNDKLTGLDYSEEGWDSEMLCYPHVFESGDQYYMLYNGNDYGKTGVGLAKTDKNKFRTFLKNQNII